jgi:hypothetical protein
MLPAQGVTVVELEYRTPLMHDDWSAGNGQVEYSDRRLCVVLRALPRFAGQATGSAKVRLYVDGERFVRVGGALPVHGGWALDLENSDLSTLPDLTVEVPAAQERVTRPTP